MTTKTRSPREELLSTLPEAELKHVVPLSEGAIRAAVERGQAEAEAVKTTEQLPTVAQTFRFQ